MNIGQQISHYTLEEKIGDGGFGDVFRARDINTGMEVAIKCSRSDAAETKLKDREQRFMREVSCLSKLRHPGIVQIFEYGMLPEDGTLYLVMEFVCGLTLETLIKRDAPYSFVAASDIILQVLDALAEAHNQGIVHRDLKPANIMLVRQGLRTNVVKLLDFGIAKAFDGTEPDLTSQNFQNGAGFGTPQYMPPEQFYGKKVGPHSDLYAVALVFYELL
ncbi:MAG: serine/threonine protein kinase, partial [Proteobacteria bacterium]|nr:serine/threonine protein kinase [Pseudomonadota bacterium]